MSRVGGPTSRGSSVVTTLVLASACVIAGLVVFGAVRDLLESKSTQNGRKKKEKKELYAVHRPVVKKAEGGKPKAPTTVERDSNLDFDSLQARELLALAGPQGRGLEYKELLQLVLQKHRTLDLLFQLFNSPDLGIQVFSFLDARSMSRLGETSVNCCLAADTDSFWKVYALRTLWKQFLPRLSYEDASLVVISLKEAFEKGYFVALQEEERVEMWNNDKCERRRRDSWKQFLFKWRKFANLRQGGYGNAVIVPREQICPHHIAKLVHLLSIRKHPGCTVAILNKFLRLYRSIQASINLRSNVGFCFPVLEDKGRGVKQTVSVSHHDFMEAVRASNLQIADLLTFFSFQKSLF